MSVSALHPDYQKHIEDWRKVRDAVEGESALRRDITYYLPVPPGMEGGPAEVLLTGKRGYTNSRYQFYARMAEFPEIISPTLNGILGLIHEKDPEIVLPADMKYLIDQCTPDGQDIYEFWERCTKDLLVTGRFVTLGDVVGDKPYLCEYPTESLINWQLRPKVLGGGPSLIVLKEVRLEPDPGDRYSYVEVTYYRQLELENGIYTIRMFKEVEGKMQEVPVFNDDDSSMGVVPMLFGKTFADIPMTIVNVQDVGYEYGPIPMLPMVRRALSIFRRSADYNRSLYIKGDPQCVIFGIQDEDIPTEIGGSSIWAFENAEGKAQYLDIDGQGIPLMEKAIANEFTRFSDEVGMLLEGSATGYESGEALKRRQSMRQVTVKSVVINAAEGMTTALRAIGKMLGKSDAELQTIEFIPNLDFTEPMMAGQELISFITAKNEGAPLSEETLHGLMRRRQVTGMTYEEERKKIEDDEKREEERNKRLGLGPDGKPVPPAPIVADATATPKKPVGRPATKT